MLMCVYVGLRIEQRRGWAEDGDRSGRGFVRRIKDGETACTCQFKRQF